MSVRLSLSEAVVLALVDETPRHGFLIAALTAPKAEIGQIWHEPRPVVYRALSRLEDEGLILPGAQESVSGPIRQVYRVSATGRRRSRRWLQEPVEHVRDVRTHLLVKLALLHRRDDDGHLLVSRQRKTLAPILKALEVEPRTPTGDFDDVLAAWRRASAVAVSTFLDELAERPSS